MPESVEMKKDPITILTVRDVAEYLRMSEAKVYRLANGRHLPAIRIGKSWRFRKDLLDQWLGQRTESGLKAEGEELQPERTRRLRVREREGSVIMATQWYVLHSKPMKESILWEQLRLHDIESYYPYIRVHPASLHARRVKPYFPGYLFAQVDLAQTNLSTLQWMPGAAGIISFGGFPSSVPDHMIAAIRRHVEEINAAGGELFHGLKPGDMVTIQDGPFRGYDAVFDSRLSGEERVRVFLKLLNRQQYPLELSSRQIQRKKQ